MSLYLRQILHADRFHKSERQQPLLKFWFASAGLRSPCMQCTDISTLIGTEDVILRGWAICLDVRAKSRRIVRWLCSREEKACIVALRTNGPAMLRFLAPAPPIVEASHCRLLLSLPPNFTANSSVGISLFFTSLLRIRLLGRLRPAFAVHLRIGASNSSASLPHQSFILSS